MADVYGHINRKITKGMLSIKSAKEIISEMC